MAKRKSGQPKKLDPKGTLKRVEKQARKKAANPNDQARAQHNFSERIDRVLELAQMTETPGWKRLYGYLRARDKKATEDLRTVEKARELVRAQETVKLISGKDGILEEVRRPIRLLNDFSTDMPLFRTLITHRAVFDEISGVVSLVQTGNGKDADAGDGKK